MKIELNQVFSSEEYRGFTSWKSLTKGRHEKPLNRFKGMPYYASCRGITPLINFNCNLSKKYKTTLLVFKFI